jgi:hypothetical protein
LEVGIPATAFHSYTSNATEHIQSGHAAIVVIEEEGQQDRPDVSTPSVIVDVTGWNE